MDNFQIRRSPNFLLRLQSYGHGIGDYQMISINDKERLVEEMPYSVALRAESSPFEWECLKYEFSSKKSMRKCYYTDEPESNPIGTGGLKGVISLM